LETNRLVLFETNSQHPKHYIESGKKFVGVAIC